MTKLLLPILTILLSLSSIGASAQDVSAKYMRITDISLLRDGDEIIVVSKDCGVAMSEYQNAKKEYILPCSVKFDMANELELATCQTDSIAIFKLKKMSGGWRLNGKNCGWLSTRTSPISALTYVDKETEKRNLIDINISNDGNATFKFKNITKNENNYLDYNPDTRRFARYLRPDYYGKVQIYRRLVNPVIVDEITLGETGGNEDIVSYYQDAYVRNITINRTFRADGGCYTLCLPFQLDENDLRTAFPGMQFKSLQSIEEEDDENVVYHFLSVKSTVAGEPYLVQFLNGVNKDVVKPIIKNKFILATKPATLSSELNSGTFKFVGTYDPVAIPADGHYRFVGADGKQLVTPNAEGDLKGLRAYFLLPSIFDNCKYDSNGKPRSVKITIDRGITSHKR